MNALVLVTVAVLAQTPIDLQTEQPLGTVHEFFKRIGEQSKDIKVGQWVRYQFTRTDAYKKKEYFLQMSVVGAQKDELGRDAVWVETEMAMHHAFKSPFFQLRALCALNTPGGLMNKDSVTRVMLAFGPEKPKEASGEVLADLFREDPENAKAKKNAEVEARKHPLPHRFDVRTAKPQALMTHAGTVTATAVDFKYKDTLIQRMWLSEQIPLMKLAKLDMPRIGHTVEVRDFGVDARSRMVLPKANEPKLLLGEMSDAWRNLESQIDEVDK